MGRLYKKTASGEKILAYFEGGTVRTEADAPDVMANYNNAGQIYQSSQSHTDKIIANCDICGNIRKGKATSGSVLAKCQDGLIADRNMNGRILAHYSGDMYGAAAAFVVLELKMGASRNPLP